MSSGAVKGIEILLIAGVVFWFAYSQLNALKRSKPSDAAAGSEREDGGASAETTENKP